MPKKAARRRSRSAKSENTGASPRGIWTGTISFGLVNIAVRVVSAKEKEDLHFTMLDPSNLSPIGYKYYNKSTGDEVTRGQTVKAYEHKRGEFVIMTDADFKKANPKATRTIDIDSFVQIEEIDPVFFDRAYYLLPDKGAEKSYRLLGDALAESKRVAIAKIVLHNRQHLVALIPRGRYLLLELLHFADEVKELRELEHWQTSVSKIHAQPREIDMAKRLVEDMSAKWKPELYSDTYRADILKRVKAKVKAGKATEITKDFEEKSEESNSRVVDLMPLLRKSLAAKHGRSKSSRRSSARAAAHR